MDMTYCNDMFDWRALSRLESLFRCVAAPALLPGSTLPTSRTSIHWCRYSGLMVRGIPNCAAQRYQSDVPVLGQEQGGLVVLGQEGGRRQDPQRLAVHDIRVQRGLPR